MTEQWSWKEKARLIEALNNIARATEESGKRRDPIFIFVPSNIDPMHFKRLGEQLRNAFAGN